VHSINNSHSTNHTEMPESFRLTARGEP